MLPLPPPRPHLARAARAAAVAATVLTAAAAAWVTAACGPGGRPTVAGRARLGDTVYIGVTGLSTDEATDTGVVNGVLLAVARLNAERPTGAPAMGLRLPPLLRVDGQFSEVATAAALRDDPQVAAVVGPTSSSAALNAAPVFGDVERDGARAVAALSPVATNPAVDRASPWLFRICASDDDAAAALARFAAESLGVRRVAIMFRNDLFGRGFTRRIAPELAALGVEVTERDPYLAGATRFDAYAARIARSGADALLVAGSASAAQLVVRAVHDAGARPALLGTDDVAAVAGRLAADPALGGLRFVSFFEANAPGVRAAPAAAAFVAAYRARFGHTPDHRAALSYDAALLAGRAVHAEAPAAGGDAFALRHRVRDAIARTGRTAPAFEGVSGVVRFGETNGAVGRRVWIGRVGA